MKLLVCLSSIGDCAMKGDEMGLKRSSWPVLRFSHSGMEGAVSLI